MQVLVVERQKRSPIPTPRFAFCSPSNIHEYAPKKKSYSSCLLLRRRIRVLGKKYSITNRGAEESLCSTAEASANFLHYLALIFTPSF